MRTDIISFLAQFGTALHITLMACIAGLLVFDFSMATASLMEINMITIGIYWVLCIYRRFLPPLSSAFSIIVIALLVAQLPSLNHATTLYINLLILIAYLIFLLLTKDTATVKIVFSIFSAPALFTLLDMFLTQDLHLTPFARNIWHAAFIAAGIWIVAKRKINWIDTYSTGLVFAGVLLYAFLLALIPTRSYLILKPIEIFGYQLSDAAIMNTSFISIYTASAFLIGLYLLIKLSWPFKVALIPALLSLLLFLSHTSWLPPWLGLIAALVLASILYSKKHSFIAIGVVILLQAILITANVHGFKDKIHNFIKTEERLIIWQDTWHMQTESAARHWIFGHGLMSFQNDFKSYSRFYKEPAQIALPQPVSTNLLVLNHSDGSYLSNFRIYSKSSEQHSNAPMAFISPHNLLLDLLYTTGLIGLGFITCFYFIVSKQLIKFTQLNRNTQLLTCFVLAALVSNTIANGLSFSFFRQYNIFPLAFICGIALFLHEKNQRHQHDGG